MHRQAGKQNIELSKEELLQATLNSSTRVAEKKMGDIAEAQGFKQKRPNEEIRLKMEQVKARLSHAYPGMTDEELILLLLDEKLATPQGKTGSESAKAPGRYIPMPIKRAVFQRDEGKCTYCDPASGRKCESQHFLQYHHKIAYALGGKTSVENLTLHCHAHNKLEARKAGLAL